MVRRKVPAQPFGFTPFSERAALHARFAEMQAQIDQLIEANLNLRRELSRATLALYASQPKLKQAHPEPNEISNEISMDKLKETTHGK